MNIELTTGEKIKNLHYRMHAAGVADDLRNKHRGILDTIAEHSRQNASEVRYDGRQAVIVFANPDNERELIIRLLRMSSTAYAIFAGEDPRVLTEPLAYKAFKWLHHTKRREKENGQDDENKQANSEREDQVL